MRIISGDYRRRKLTGPPDAETTRPIPDRVKLALFNMLRGYTKDAAVFDCFAGTGSIGLEAVSLGATRCVFVERDKKILEILQRNIDHLGVGDRVEIVRGDALGPMALARCPDPADLVFMDPPYKLISEPDGWERCRAQATRLIRKLGPEGWLVLRTPWPFVFTPEVATPGEDAPEAAMEIDLDADDADDALDAFEAELAEAAERVKPVDAELKLEGALGPETHVYRHTAVHLYQRDTEPAEDSGSGDGGDGGDD